MGEMELASGEEREKAELARKNALEGLRADYRMTAETRREVGVDIPSYEVWLERQVLLWHSLHAYEQGEKEALMTRALDGVDRVGNAYIELSNQQTARIEALRKALQMIADGEFFEEENASVARAALEADKANGPG